MIKQQSAVLRVYLILISTVTGVAVLGAEALAARTVASVPSSEVSPGALELREVRDDSLAQAGTAIPTDAVQVFVYAGEPRGIRITDKHIAVDYGRCGVLFDRKSGKSLRQFTMAQGWPEVQPESFKGGWLRSPKKALVGPGIVQLYVKDRGSDHIVATSAVFEGRSFRALQPQPPEPLLRLLRERIPSGTNQSVSWTSILARWNEQCYVEVSGEEGDAPRRYTMADGLASNIVSHLVAAQGSLWAACVDIYDAEKKQWGPGGLCRFNPQTSRWERIDEIDGRPVRWVTLLQAVGDELWVGFREGEGIAGDQIWYGMALGVGHYRPKTTALVLARLAQGKWTTFSRRPSSDLSPRNTTSSRTKPLFPPTEAPHKLCRYDNNVILFSGPRNIRIYNSFDYKLDGQVSLLDLKSGKWHILDARADLGADFLIDMIIEDGETLLASNIGVHRWDPEKKSWQLLDPKGELRNPSLSTIVPVGDELWLGYKKHGFGFMGKQGISIFSEQTGSWSYMSPEKLGTVSWVRSIAPLANGEVWVLFSPGFPAAANAEFFPFDKKKKADRRGGLGRFAHGEWVFPVTPEGIAMDPRRGYFGFVAMGDKLFLSNTKGVYLGPGQWRQVVSGPVRRIQPSDDKKSLIVVRWEPDWDRSSRRRLQLGHYDLATGEATFETLEGAAWSHWFQKISHVRQQESFYGIRPFGDGEWSRSWVRVPSAKEGDWAIGPLSKKSHSVVQTPHALWIASRGELIRLDRKRLSQWLGE